jgi:hypothetical protein
MGIDNSGKASVYKLLEEEANSCLVLATDQEKRSKGETESKVWVVRKENKVSVLVK